MIIECSSFCLLCQNRNGFPGSGGISVVVDNANMFNELGPLLRDVVAMVFGFDDFLVRRGDSASFCFWPFGFAATCGTLMGAVF